MHFAADTEEFRAVAEQLPTGTETALLVEFYAESDEHGRQQVADLIADRLPDRTATEGLGGGTDSTAVDTGTNSETDASRAFDVVESHDPAGIAELWKLRKSAAPILLSRTSDAKHISFIEDTAVPTASLADYVAEFQDVLEEHDTFASFYAHAGPGCMHIAHWSTRRIQLG
jgi:FAD/FMN-containing dehydrogenase